MKRLLPIAFSLILFLGCKKDSDTTENPNPITPTSCRVTSSNAGPGQMNFEISYNTDGHIQTYKDYTGPDALPVVYIFEYGADSKVKITQSNNSTTIWAKINASGNFTEIGQGFDTMKIYYYPDGKVKSYDQIRAIPGDPVENYSQTVTYEGGDIKKIDVTITGTHPGGGLTSFHYNESKVFKVIPQGVFLSFDFPFALPALQKMRMPDKVFVEFWNSSANYKDTSDYHVSLDEKLSDGTYLIKSVEGDFGATKWTGSSHTLVYENCK